MEMYSALNFSPPTLLPPADSAAPGVAPTAAPADRSHPPPTRCLSPVFRTHRCTRSIRRHTAYPLATTACFALVPRYRLLFALALEEPHPPLFHEQRMSRHSEHDTLLRECRFVVTVTPPPVAAFEVSARVLDRSDSRQYPRTVSALSTWSSSAFHLWQSFFPVAPSAVQIESCTTCANFPGIPIDLGISTRSAAPPGRVGSNTHRVLPEVTDTLHLHSGSCVHRQPTVAEENNGFRKRARHCDRRSHVV